MSTRWMIPRKSRTHKTMAILPSSPLGAPMTHEWFSPCVNNTRPVILSLQTSTESRTLNHNNRNSDSFRWLIQVRSIIEIVLLCSGSWLDYSAILGKGQTPSDHDAVWLNPSPLMAYAVPLRCWNSNKVNMGWSSGQAVDSYVKTRLPAMTCVHASMHFVIRLCDWALTSIHPSGWLFPAFPSIPMSLSEKPSMRPTTLWLRPGVLQGLDPS